MSSPDRSAELLVIAERVVAMAAPGEQVEQSKLLREKAPSKRRMERLSGAGDKPMVH